MSSWGAANPHRGCLEQTAKESPHRVELLSNVDDMPRQYMWADGIIGAGGSSWLGVALLGTARDPCNC